MKQKEIREFVGLEVLIVSTDEFRNYGIIEYVDAEITKIKTPHGKMSILNENIYIIKEKPVRWN